MKYVAFLDILGFKETLSSLKQHEAEEYIKRFSSTAALAWDRLHYSSLNGYIVSDSFIIYTNDVSINSLIDLLTAVNDVCRIEFSENSILMRGAVAKGEFERIEAKELTSLKKGLIVGQAYVDAYLLEGKVKVPGIILSDSVYEDVCNITEFSRDFYNMKSKNTVFHILRYLFIDYLLEEARLEGFIRLACDSKWLPHYYNALNIALWKEKNDKKVQQVFDNIFNLVCKNDPHENWRDIDTFISHAFDEDVEIGFQSRLLKFIREKIF